MGANWRTDISLDYSILEVAEVTVKESIGLRIKLAHSIPYQKKIFLTIFGENTE